MPQVWDASRRGCLTCQLGVLSWRRLAWQDGRMRRILAFSLSLLVAAACTDGHAAARPSDGALVLEVGGVDSSLRRTLQAAGMQLAAPELLRPVAPPEPVPDGPAPVEPQPGIGDAPKTTDGPGVSPPPPPADHIVVTLAPKQTLTHLAKKHLGDGTRYPEIMKLNGWDERAILRLQPGQKVKIPKATSAR